MADTVTDLDVTYDRKLSHASHIDIVAKASLIRSKLILRCGVSHFAGIWGQILNAHIPKTVRDNHYGTRFRLTRGRSVDWDRFQSARKTYV